MARPADKIADLLQDFTRVDVDEAVSMMRDGRPVAQPSSYDTDVGPEMDPGEGGVVVLEDLATIERLIDESNLLPVHFLTEGAALQGAVGKVIVSPPGWVGTGFMVSPSLLMTNHHVLRNEEDARNARVKFNFQYDHNGNDQAVEEFEADPDSFFHTSDALDYTVVRLKPKVQVPRLRPRPIGVAGGPVEAVGGDPAVVEMTVPATASLDHGIPPSWLIRAGSKWGFIPLQPSAHYAAGQRLNVIQHPRGRRKEVALQANTVTNIFADHVRYSTDTEPGSSGSPVLNNAWELVALHHAAGSRDSAGNWQDNQGVRVDKIVADLRSSLGGSSQGAAALSELGI